MKYVVPQFIDVEDKIIGPITARQFVILLVTALFAFISYKLFDFTLFVVVGLVEFAIGGIIAFLRINGQPFHFFMLNVVQTLRRPMLRPWDKELTPGEIRELAITPPPPPPSPRIRKEALVARKLSDLSLVVNTGGIYNPEEA